MTDILGSGPNVRVQAFRVYPHIFYKF